MPGGFTFVSRTRTWGLDLSGSPQGAGGVGGLLADGDALGGLWYPTYDGNGNVSEYVSKTAVTTAHYEYDAFGNTVFASGALSAPAFACRFSTKMLDAETEWCYYGFRYYAPKAGRWTSMDPLGELGGFNLYASLDNNIPNGVDYLGLKLKEFTTDAAAITIEEVTSLPNDFAAITIATWPVTIGLSYDADKGEKPGGFGLWCYIYIFKVN